MAMWVRLAGLCMLFLSLCGGGARAEDRKVYFFGNSLIHHLSDSDETAVPHWLALMARAAGHGFAADGQWGFLRDFTRDVMPLANWSFRDVKGAWDRDRQDFAAAGWDAVVVSPSNFVQYQGPDAPYDGDNPGQESPFSAMLALIDAHGVAPVLIYEGWAEMTDGFPPGKRAFARYNAHNMGAYHAWYEVLADELRAARPGKEVRLIPVAKILSEVFAEGPLQGLAPDKLYVDADPHGTPTLYLLAAMITYSALYDEPAPVGLTLPESIAPEVQRAYPLLAVTFNAKLRAYRAEAGALPGQRQPEKAEAGVQVQKPEIAGQRRGGAAEGLADPALAMGLNGIADWSTQQPFIDIMKSARPWLGHEPGKWGAWDAARLGREGYLDPQGWVKAFPPGVNRVESFVLTDQNAAASAMLGRYRVRWQGSGELRLGGRARQVRYGEKEAWFRYAPGEGEVAVTIVQTDPEATGDHIREIEIVREDLIALHELGVVFNPQWIARIADLRVLRFMDWMQTNGSPVKGWQDRPRRGDFSYGWRGVPVEVMIDLANFVGADPWFCMPHAADDAYSRRFAEMVRDRLDPRLKVHVEYSNELWNFTFPQAHWAAEQARVAWGDDVGGDAWMRYAGQRAGEVMRLWAEAFAQEADARLVRVVAVHTGWMGLEAALLEKSTDHFDAYAVSGYFGFELGDEEEGRLRDLRTWIAESRAAAEKAARAKGLKRRAFDAEVAPVRFDQAVPKAAEAVRAGSLKELTEVLWPYHAGVAKKHGLRLIMYEGGTHAVGHGAAVNDDELTAFFAAFSYSDAMAGLYRDALARWRALGGSTFNAFVDVARSSRHGNWGALRHLEDDNPRWDTLMAANARGSGAEEGRAPGAFLHGALHNGGDRADVLEGTFEEDILLGRDGDDRILSLGGSDFIDGGPGQDVVRLPGVRGDYSFAMEAARLLAVRRGTETRLRGIEILEFAGEPGRQYRIDLP